MMSPKATHGNKREMALGAILLLASAGCGDAAISPAPNKDASEGGAGGEPFGGSGGSDGFGGQPSGGSGGGAGGGMAGRGGAGGGMAGQGGAGGSGRGGTGGSPGPRAPREGFGAQTPGGEGGRVISVTQATEKAVADAFAAAKSGKAIIDFQVQGPIMVRTVLAMEGSFVTIKGNGVTLVGTGGGPQALVELRGHDVIMQDMRLRNAYDNVRAQDPGAYNIVFDHISSTGSSDDGISIGYGAHDVTIQYSFVAGCTRAIFIKYGDTTNVSVHHNWIQKHWIRGPICESAMCDVRNNIHEDWTMWSGPRFESGGKGNSVSELFILSAYAESQGGKPAATAYGYGGPGPTWFEGNVFRDKAMEGTKSTAPGPLPAPPVTTMSVDQMEPIVRAQAGCMPRDAIDQKYIDAKTGWDVGGSTAYRP